jgi:hypothetical protein
MSNLTSRVLQFGTLPRSTIPQDHLLYGFILDIMPRFGISERHVLGIYNEVTNHISLDNSFKVTKTYKY